MIRNVAQEATHWPVMPNTDILCNSTLQSPDQHVLLVQCLSEVLGTYQKYLMPVCAQSLTQVGESIFLQALTCTVEFAAEPVALKLMSSSCLPIFSAKQILLQWQNYYKQLWRESWEAWKASRLLT